MILGENLQEWVLQSRKSCEGLCLIVSMKLVTLLVQQSVLSGEHMGAWERLLDPHLLCARCCARHFIPHNYPCELDIMVPLFFLIFT